MTELISDSSRTPASFVDGAGYATIKEWIAENQQWESLLYQHGYLIFRNFPISDAGSFDSLLDVLMCPSREFSEETSPRSTVSSRLFTSTDYPAKYAIQFHHEFSYRQNYPDRLAFCCLTAPRKGGATPVADSRKMMCRMSADVISKFERLGIAYVRNFRGLGVSWSDAFGTDDKSAISAYCDEHDITYSWHGDDLHTRQVTPAVTTHPVTGERAWFNSVLNLNIAGVEPEAVRNALSSLPASSVPTNTTYGSGEPIEPEVLEHIRETYAEEGVRFDWQTADLMLIDNVLTAHAREPYEGDRRVLVGMGSALAPL